MSNDYSTTTTSNWDTTAYEQLAYFAFRPENYFDGFCDVKPTRQSHPGAIVNFNVTSDLSVVSTAINQSVDVDSVAVTDTNVTVTLAEYANVAKSTKKLRGTSYLPVDAVLANLIAYNAGVSIDTIVRDVAKGGSNVRYVGGATSRTTVESSDDFGASVASTGSTLIRRSVAELRGANVPTIGGSYVGVIHPDVSFDLRGATGGANWRDPHTYSAPDAIFNGEIGMFEGVRFLESPRAPVFADAGSSTTLTDVYATLIFGQQALAKAWSITDGGSPMPSVFPTPVVDNVRRFLGAAWYHLVGYGIFRQESLRRIESSSSIGTNA